MREPGGRQDGKSMTERTDGPTVSRMFGALTALGVLPLALLVGHFGGIARGGTAPAFAIAVVFACKIHWDLRDAAWFWGGAVVLVVLHCPIVVFAPWPYSGAAFLPIAFLDLAADWGFLKLLARVMNRGRRTADSG